MEPMKPMEPMEPMKPMKPMEPMKPMKPQEAWWPASLGTPDSSGAQNDARYAYFAEARRLVIDVAGAVKIYDTGTHRIQGFGQQSGGSPMRFQSDDGVIDVNSLKISA